jgi:hypothetical protein
MTKMKDAPITATDVREREVRMVEDLKRMMSMPRTARPAPTDDHKKLYARVIELEGYMPILLDKLEKQDDKIDELSARLDRALPHSK